MNIYDNDVLDVAMKEFNYILDINLNKRKIVRLFSNIPQISEKLTYETYLLTFGSNVPLVDKTKARYYVNQLTTALKTKDFRSFVIELRFVDFLTTNSFEWASIKVNFVEVDGDIHAHIVSRDITDEKANEIKVIKSYQRDSLTNLYNRIGFNTVASDLLLSSNNSNNKFAFFFIDIDNFKKVNDVFGHLAGDKVLIDVAQLLSKILNNESIICRYGGDEFIALVPHMNEIKSINILADSICRAMRLINKQGSENQEYGISCSIGISRFPDHSINLVELTRFADLALYKAKAQGKNQFEIYEKDYDINNVTYSKIKNDDKINNYYALLDKILINSDTGILVTDALDFKVLFANKVFCDLFNIQEQDIYLETKFCYSLIYGLSEPCKNCNSFNNDGEKKEFCINKNGKNYTCNSKKIEWLGHFVVITYYSVVLTEEEISGNLTESLNYENKNLL